MSVILKRKWIFMGIALVLIIASIASLAIRGFKLDTDFSGGIAVTYKINTEFDTKDVEALVSEALGAEQKASSVQRSNGNEVVIKFGYDNSLETDEARSDFAMSRVNAITEALVAKYDPAGSAAVETEEAAATETAKATTAEATTEEATTEETATEETATEEVAEAVVTLKSQDIISPSTGRELAESAIWMSILACIAILIYVTIRFEFTSGVVAVVCLVHDVLLLMGIYSLLQIAIDTNFIAAVLTVLGYSINNTIVIMDRIRENTRHARKETYEEIADKSIMGTIGRSINTSITTLLTIGMVYILGVPSIKVFSLPIIIGILIGFYSSVFVAGSLWATWKDAGVKGKKKA